jgi:hypothetical protein
MDKQDKAVLLKVHPFCLTGKHTVPEWALKLNNVLAAEETWHLKYCTLKVSILEHENQIKTVYKFSSKSQKDTAYYFKG